MAPRMRTLLATATGGALLAGLAGCSSPDPAASDTAEPKSDASEPAASSWDPGRYLELYTQPHPGGPIPSATELIKDQPWDPGRYLELYTQPHPGGPIPSATELIKDQPWDPGRYLELYTR